MSVEIFYTGDLITPDGSDSGIYGDGCEPGDGATMESGWVDPDWSRRQVHAERDHVRPDTFDGENDGPLIDWIVERLDSRLYWIELETGGTPGTYYSGKADTDPYTGESITLAAHIYGASDAILTAVAHRLAHERREQYARMRAA